MGALEGLNDKQLEAVDYLDGPLLVVAGPGSGKTLVITHRIARLVELGIPPKRITALTFTNKAANEMKGRARRLTGKGLEDMLIGTFHAVCSRILRAEGYSFIIYDEGNQEALMRDVLKKIGEDVRGAGDWVQAVSRWKDELMRPDDVGETVGGDEGNIYQEYQRELMENGAMDFGDLIMNVVLLLEGNRRSLERWQERALHLLVDEWQDTNVAQYRMVKALGERSGNVVVVGDEDQCLAEDTLVTMGNGNRKKIEDIQVGDYVMSNYGNGSLRPARVSMVSRRDVKEKEGVEIETAKGRVLTSTKVHTHFGGYRFVPRSRDSSRRNVTVTLCGDPRGLSTLHRISMSGNDVEGMEKLIAHGFNVRGTKGSPDNWRFESSYADFGMVRELVGAMRGVFGDVNEKYLARLGPSREEYNSLPFIPASSLRPGMAMFGEDGEYDTVRSVRKVPLEVAWDIDVEGTHNFIANGIVTHNSIYTWRGADIRNIMEFEKDFPGAKVIKLEQNYRSTKNILAAATEVVKRNHNRREKTLWTANDEGVEVRLWNGEDRDDEADWVVGEILRQGWSGNGGVAVLFRTNAQSRALESACLRMKLGYNLVGMVGFYERKEIRDILAYLRLTERPNDSVSFSRVMRLQPGIGIKTVESIEVGADRERRSMYEVFQRMVGQGRKRPWVAFSEKLVKLEMLKGKTADDALNVIVNNLGYGMEVLRGQDERWDNVRELIALARDKGIGEFLEQVALHGREKEEGHGRGLTLMTLHSAKGLEFKVVFMVGLENGVLPHFRSFESIKRLEEERRLCYVGMTRAQEVLYMTWSGHKVSEYVEDIPEGLKRWAT